jgi:hypothetical protein
MEQLGGGAHRRAQTAVTLRRSPVRRRGSGGGKPARWTPGQWGRVCGARAWTDEMNDAPGRKFSVGGRRLCFKGSGGEGAEGWAPCGGGVGERERGGHGRSVEQRDGVTSAWRAAGSTRRGRRC